MRKKSTRINIHADLAPAHDTHERERERERERQRERQREGE